MRILFAFVITVFIYSLLIWLYFSSFQKIKLHKKQSFDNIIKIAVVNIPLPKKEKIAKVDKIVKKESKKILDDKKLKKDNKKRIIKKKIKKREPKAKNKKKPHISK
ncbi:hypothetical protein GSY74_08065, partial [Sulfurovum sp. bin170]|uniref:hypothetical protein n=1 Tax=Sulfurovum sp. bin170 TaxID=2695268 RepID=UPI0014185F9B